jgi:ammonium transporter, Amt family
MVKEAVSLLVFYIIGFGIAYGNGNGVVGMNSFMIDSPERLASLLFRSTLAATVPFVVAGAVAERFKMSIHVASTAVLSGFIHPVFAHWVWSKDGFMSPYNKDCIGSGFIDFGGALSIHILGGCFGFVGSRFVGPRLGRFDYDTRFQPHAQGFPFSALGCFFIWIGWIGMHGGTGIEWMGEGHSGGLIGVVALNTMLASATSCLFVLALAKLRIRRYDLGKGISGIMCGLVSISASAGVVRPWAAMVIAIVGAFAFLIGVFILEKMRIDDTLEVTAVHLLCGMWSVLSVGLFAEKDLLKEYLGRDVDSYGLLRGGGYGMLTYQTVVEFFFVVLCFVISYIVFVFLNNRMGLRVNPQDEIKGLDDIYLETPAMEEMELPETTA